MEANNNPRRFFAVDFGKVVLEPFDLFVGRSERTAVSPCIEPSVFIWGLDAHWEVSLGIDDNEMRKTVVERVPEVAVATRLSRWHVEVINCMCRRWLGNSKRSIRNIEHTVSSEISLPRRTNRGGVCYVVYNIGCPAEDVLYQKVGMEVKEFKLTHCHSSPVSYVSECKL